MSSCKSSMLSGFISMPLHFMISCLIRKATEKMSRNSEAVGSVLAVDIKLSESEGAQLLPAFMASINDIELLCTTSGLACWGG